MSAHDRHGSASRGFTGKSQSSHTEILAYLVRGRKVEWLNERFGVKIESPTTASSNTMYVDLRNKLYDKAPDVSKALLQYLGINGWELVTVNSHDNMFFKRPLTP